MVTIPETGRTFFVGFKTMKIVLILSLMENASKLIALIKSLTTNPLMKLKRGYKHMTEQTKIPRFIELDGCINCETYLRRVRR